MAARSIASAFTKPRAITPNISAPDAPEIFRAVTSPTRPNQKRPASAMKQMYLHRSSCGQEPPIRRRYDTKFRASDAYRATMPDMMEVAHETIQGAHVPIQQVGISN